MLKEKTLRLFLGSYAEADHDGVYVCDFDPETGKLTLVSSVSGLKNPTFLDVDAERMILYTIAEESDDQGNRAGAAAAYRIGEDGTLTLLNRERTVPASTCHITLDRSRQCAIVASYHGGMVGLSPIAEDGSIGPLADLKQHEGSSVLPVQSQARAHSVFIDPNNRFAVACDLGLDKIFTYRLDAKARTLTYVSEVQVAPGSGPRHFAFHPTLPRGYVINELNATITAFEYDAETGTLTELQTVSTLPEDYQGENACADIHISPDGRYLYGSNRGHDSIAVYSIDPDTGKLALVEHTPVQGKHPRNFALSPDGAYLLAANRDTDNVVVFARDAATGKLKPTGHSLTVSKPVCVKFLV